MKALIGSNFAVSANCVSKLKFADTASFDSNEMDISGAQNGVIWSVRHLSSVLEERAFVDVS